MLPGQWQRPKHSRSLAVIESASRCAVRPSQAHSPARPAALTGAKGRPVRVHVGCHYSEPQAARQAFGAATAGCTGVLLRRSRVAQGHRKQLSASGAADGKPPNQQPRPRRLLQQNRPKADVTADGSDACLRQSRLRDCGRQRLKMTQTIVRSLRLGLLLAIGRRQV